MPSFVNMPILTLISENLSRRAFTRVHSAISNWTHS